jgi:glucokinase
MILAGDIGGTHARLALFDVSLGRYAPFSLTVFPSHQYSGLDAIVVEYLALTKVHPQAACFGVAGPILNGRVETTNLPWRVDARHIAEKLEIGNVMLINDLEATAWGIAALDAKDLIALNHVRSELAGTQAVIAAGTGLGEAGLYWDGSQHHVFACEGGHCDFGPRDDLELELFRYLHKLFGHVSWERILSGPGLVNVFHFLRDTGRGVEPKWLTEELQLGDPAAAISRAAMEEKCPLAEQALAMFISIYGAEAGNLALKTLAKGGVFVAGGIAPKILGKLAGPLFIHSFASKGRMQPLLETIPVRVTVNDNTALMGAARYAAVKLAETP